MEIKIKRTIVILSVCLMIFTALSAVMVSAPPPEDIPPDNNLLALVQEIKVELKATGIDASDASIYGEQIWELTGNSHGWVCIRDAIDDIKDEVEAAGVDASNSEFYARAIWELAGNSHGWVCIRDAIDEIKNAMDSVGLVVDEIKDDMDDIGPDAEAASIYSEQTWELTGNSHDWVCIRDALDEIKNEIETVVPDAYDARLYSEQTWGLTGNSHEWANIRDALDDMKNQLNSIENQLDNSMQMLFYYNNGWVFDGQSQNYWIPGSIIETNKPALFTVAYHISNDAEVRYTLGIWSIGGTEPFIEGYNGDDRSEYGQVTFPSEGMSMRLYIDKESFGGWDIRYTIMVQGTPGTTVTIMNPN